MKNIVPLLILLGLTAQVFSAKTMVIFTSGTDSLRSLANLDSARFSDANFLMHKGASSTSTSLASIDSIRFYDGAAVFTPEMLYNAYTASPMKLTANKASVTLDLRNRTSGFTGEISTDAIDLLDTANADISTLASLSNLTVATQAVIPAGTVITLSYKTGNTFFAENGWSAWTAAPSLNCNLTGLSGRYLKLRWVLQANDTSALPAISKVSVYGNYASLPAYTSAISLTSYENERIITGPYAFGWESRDNAAVNSFTVNNNLATVMAAATGEFNKIYALTDWVARKPQGSYSWSIYPWDINQVYVSDTIHGHCMSYAEVLITGLTGLGYYARHWAIEEYVPQADGPNDHEVVEVWSNTLKKWVYQDPSLDTYYANPITGEPLSILEMHDIYMTSGNITNVDGKYHYGVYTPTYDWHRFQGYATTGFIRLTERNNFHSQPSPVFNDFGNGICGINAYHCWIDSLTQTCDSTITLFSGRKRDFWYTLNQASIKAKRSAEGTLTLEFGNSQPFFHQYAVSVDNGAPVVQTGAGYAWTLHNGMNTLTVTPEDNWGTQGLSSTITLTR
jgi:hypothetical protein